MFAIVANDSKSRARTGKISTPHGIVETPSYVIVGTHAEVRCLTPEDLRATEIQIIIANTYHLWRTLGEDGLANFEGLHAEMQWDGPVMTDSGGFQVFSLGAAREHGTRKTGKSEHKKSSLALPNQVRVTDAGVYFTPTPQRGLPEQRTEGADPRSVRGFTDPPGSEEMYLDAELSIRIQEQLGADIIFAFDEPSSSLHDYDYTKLAMERTHRWAERSLEAKTSEQKIYGIVQGGAFEDLRKESAKFIGDLPFDGFGIGGAFGESFGDKRANNIKELDWVIPLLPANKPRHLLGIGRIEDLFLGVAAGIDTFDCVVPTREARHGSLWTAQGRVDIKRGEWASSDEPLGSECVCEACALTTRGDLYLRFKQKDPEAGRLATIHNVYFFNNLMRQIREHIQAGDFKEFEREYLKKLGNK